jgi:competence protein ComEC
MEIDVGTGVVLTVLHPPDSGSGESDGPIVLRLEYGRTCFLLTGSADGDVEKAILRRGERVRCDVVHVGRGGREGASTLAFVEAVRPALAVISCGEGSRSTCPAEAVVRRWTEQGATVLRTDVHGSVEVISDGTRCEVRVRQ